MWGGLLPGIREIRVPLAAGYLWLLAFWLFLEPYFPAGQQPTGVLASLLRLHELLSVAGTAIGLSALAYFIGSVSEATLGMWSRRQARYGGLLFTSDYGTDGRRVLRTISEREAERLSAALQPTGGLRAALVRPPRRADTPALHRLLIQADRQIIGNVLGQRGTELSYEDDAVAYLSLVLQEEIGGELGLVKTRLLATERELHAQADRHSSEADLRFAVAPPLLAMVGVLVIRWSALWLFAVIAVVVLWAQGRSRRFQSGDVLVEALRLERSSTPLLDELHRELERL